MVSLAALVVFGLIAYLRYPTYITAPNFYAEDGTVFGLNVAQHGFLHALFSPFNGYFVFGIYLLEGAGFVLNWVQGGTFLDLPQALAVASYAFWGLLAALPLLLFWNDMRRKIWLVLIGLSLVILPMPSFNYAVLGTVGNCKFAFLFIAFLLIIKRWRLAAGSKWVYLLDAALIVCIFTDASVYMLLPFALVPYWPGIAKLRTAGFWKSLLHNRGFMSLVGMGVLAASQLAYITMKGGVNTLQGYLQEPFQFGKTIEIFVHRTLLYPFDFSIAKHLNDVLVVVILLALLGVLWFYTEKRDRLIILFGLWTALSASAIFVSQRPGVSQFFSHYQSSGTDHFFYAQNMVMVVAVLFPLARYIERRTLSRHTWVLAALVMLTPFAMFAHNDIGHAKDMNRTTGPLLYATQQACAMTTGATVQVPVYPEGVPHLPLARRAFCTPRVTAFIPRLEPLKLTPSGNHYIELSTSRVSQTFRADYPDLSGVSLFLSTFATTSSSQYRLSLLDASCQHTLRQATFSANTLADNSYFDIRFTPVSNSKNRTYCFRVSSVRQEPGKPSIAVQLSAPNSYSQGAAAQDGNTLNEDVVFDLLYR